jgi:hypothetical protein
MDFGNTLFEHNRSATPEEADLNAFWADWSAIGFDLENVISQDSSVPECAKADQARIGCREKAAR